MTTHLTFRMMEMLRRHTQEGGLDTADLNELMIECKWLKEELEWKEYEESE